MDHSGRAVGIHLASENEGRNISAFHINKKPKTVDITAAALEALHETASDLTSTRSMYSSDSVAFVICRDGG